MEEKVIRNKKVDLKKNPVSSSLNQMDHLWFGWLRAQKTLKGIKEAFFLGGWGNQREEILLKTKNILATSEVINKQSKIKKEQNFLMELRLLRILDFDRNQLDI